MSTPIYENRFWCQSCGWSYVDRPTNPAVTQCFECGGGTFANIAPTITRGAQADVTQVTTTERPKPWKPRIVSDDE